MKVINNFTITISNLSNQHVDIDEFGSSSSFDEINIKDFKNEFESFLKEEIEIYLEDRSDHNYNIEDHLNNLEVEIKEESETYRPEEDRWSHNTGHFTVEKDPVNDQTIIITVKVKNPKLKTFIDDDIDYIKENITEMKILNNLNISVSNEFSFFYKTKKIKSNFFK